MKKSILLITSTDKKKLFEIDYQGNVFYMKKGNPSIVKNQKQLALAMGQALWVLGKANEKKLKKQGVKFTK